MAIWSFETDPEMFLGLFRHYCLQVTYHVTDLSDRDDIAALPGRASRAAWPAAAVVIPMFRPSSGHASSASQPATTIDIWKTHDVIDELQNSYIYLVLAR